MAKSPLLSPLHRDLGAVAQLSSLIPHRTASLPSQDDFPTLLCWREHGSPFTSQLALAPLGCSPSLWGAITPSLGSLTMLGAALCADSCICCLSWTQRETDRQTQAENIILIGIIFTTIDIHTRQERSSGTGVFRFLEDGILARR